MNKELTALSASRISTAKSCSWKYWCNYHLKLPEKTNDGALMGTVCHALFECLGNPRHKKHYAKIIKKQDIAASPACERLITYGLNKFGIFTDERLKLVKAMCLNGLNYDFYAERYSDQYGNPNIEDSESAFDITIEKPEVKFRIKGFIDKLWLFKHKTCALIRDFKSSKKIYTNNEMEENLQNLIYVYAVKHLYPSIIKQRVEFLFLRFPLDAMHEENGIVHGLPLDENALTGLENYLTLVQQYIDTFDESVAKSDMAKSRPFPKDGTFSGPLMCGRAKFPGDLKKDGNPHYYCPYKFPFVYYVLKDEKDKIVSSAFEEELEVLFNKQHDAEKVGSVLNIEQKVYEGCPAWKKFS
jgi:hypothetical protein